MKNELLHPPLHNSRSVYLLAALVIGALLWSYVTSIDISIHSRGVVRPDGEPIRVAAEAGGRVRSVDVQEGDWVRSGDPIVQLDTRELLLRKQNIDTRRRFIELRLTEVQRQIDDAIAIEAQSALVDTSELDAAQRVAKIKVDTARDRFARAELLFREGLLARQAYDESQTAFTQAELEKANSSLEAFELKRIQSAVHIRSLRGQALPLRADLAMLSHDLEQTRLEIARLTIPAPCDGQITSLVPLHPDEIVAAGNPIATVVPDVHAQVIETWLPASERDFVHNGQTVRLRSESSPLDSNNAFEGVVQFISPDARFKDAATGAYRVLVKPIPSSLTLRLGMTFDVAFITREERLLWLLFERIRAEFR